jgi:hypothetical protein
MDEQRYEREAKQFKNFVNPRKSDKFFNYRLVREEEIPDWVKEPICEPERDLPTGRGHRKKKEINYYYLDYEE